MRRGVELRVTDWEQFAPRRQIPDDQQSDERAEEADEEKQSLPDDHCAASARSLQLRPGVRLSMFNSSALADRCERSRTEVIDD